MEAASAHFHGSLQKSSFLWGLNLCAGRYPAPQDIPVVGGDGRRLRKAQSDPDCGGMTPHARFRANADVGGWGR